MPGYLQNHRKKQKMNINSRNQCTYNKFMIRVSIVRREILRRSNKTKRYSNLTIKPDMSRLKKKGKTIRRPYQKIRGSISPQKSAIIKTWQIVKRKEDNLSNNTFKINCCPPNSEKKRKPMQFRIESWKESISQKTYKNKVFRHLKFDLIRSSKLRALEVRLQSTLTVSISGQSTSRIIQKYYQNDCQQYQYIRDMSWRGKIMNEVTREPIESHKQKDIGFRERDLDYLIRQCQQKFEILSELKKQKQEIQKFCEEHGVSLNANINEGKDNTKLKTDGKPKKVLKCTIKSCGKIMNSEANYSTHMKNHNQDKKSAYPIDSK